MELLKPRKDTHFLKITKKEALALIVSLATQIKNKNPNINRLELTSNNKYFSIAVIDN